MEDRVIDLQRALYAQGLTQGTEGFNAAQKRLYDYLDLLYSVEMDSFTGLLYNNLGKNGRMLAFVQCLFYFGLVELSQQLASIYLRARGQQREEAEDWEDFLTRLHLIDEVDALEKDFYQAIAGRPMDEWMEQHYTDLSAGVIIP